MHGSTVEKRAWLIVLAVLDFTQSALGHGRNREALSAFDTFGWSARLQVEYGP